MDKKFTVINNDDVKRFLSADAQERLQGYINYIQSGRIRLGETVEEVVVISKREYKELLDDSNVLSALDIAGVDNWDGWDDAMELLRRKNK